MDVFSCCKRILDLLPSNGACGWIVNWAIDIIILHIHVCHNLVVLDHWLVKRAL